LEIRKYEGGSIAVAQNVRAKLEMPQEMESYNMRKGQRLCTIWPRKGSVAEFIETIVMTRLELSAFLLVMLRLSFGVTAREPQLGKQRSLSTTA
jgi:hypothetical protein